MNELNPISRQFADGLIAALNQKDVLAASHNTQQKVHVTGAGGAVTFAYEQLRNAAEYTEEHLLLQRAIRRFYKRLFLTRDADHIGKSGEELIVELTLAGYLENDTVTEEVLGTINKLAADFYAAQTKYGKDSWALNVLAVEVERLLSRDERREVFVQFAYEHFAGTIDQGKLFGKSVADFEVSLFVAVHRALLKSDPATIRASLLHRYQQTPHSASFKETNQKIDKILESETTDKLFRVVDRQGAPLRILWRLIDEQENATQLLQSREQFLLAYENQIEKEYTRINSRINKGIIKSVIFLIITKVIIGVAIEIPYDYMVHGAIIALPLAINLLFPPVYMVLLRFTLNIPDGANTHALVDATDHLLYGTERALSASYPTSKGFGLAFNAAYIFCFIVVFGGVAWWLLGIGFSLLHLLIFFIFLSTASFLGFRLSQQIRELEVLAGTQNGVTVLRDFLYIPFVVVGRWMSEKYARVNIVAMMLDMVIELPLKTVLHLIRQWGAFITSKKDEL